MKVRFKHVDYAVDRTMTLPAVPRQGDKVKVDGRKCRVTEVTWVIEHGEETVVKVLLEDWN